MATTKNGWMTAPKSRVRVGVGGDTGEVRAGDVAVLFQHLLNSYDAFVEPVRIVNGYRTPEFNQSVGGTASSNHISATALDINGDKHPYEIKLGASKRYGNFDNGFTDQQVAAIRDILDYFEGAIGWGQDFSSGWRDPMHFEIKGNSTLVARIAAKIRNLWASEQKPPSTPPPLTEDKKPDPVKPNRTIMEIIVMDSLRGIIHALFVRHMKKEPAEADYIFWINHFASTGGDLNNLWHNIANSEYAKSLRS